MRIRQTCLWTALVTPFTADGGTDFISLATLLKQQEQAGNGILILGSTGESLALSEDEKRALVEFTLEQKLSVPIMAGVPNVNMAQTLAWMDFCRGKGVNAYLAATPLYSKPAAQGQVEWFTKIFDAADAPVMLYNVPSRTGAVLSPAVLQALHGHKNFWAIKESSGGLDAYADYAAAAAGIALYCGDDHLFPSAVPLGAVGLVSVAANVWPDACHAYVAACRSGAYHGQEWWLASKALFSTTSPVPVKWLMHNMGQITDNYVRLPLSNRDLTDHDSLRTANSIVKAWHKSILANHVRHGQSAV